MLTKLGIIEILELLTDLILGKKESVEITSFSSSFLLPLHHPNEVGSKFIFFGTSGSQVSSNNIF